ncbi:MAG: FliA/WhiG family RNA polymerase sigma factor [Candidatus Brocadiaceae bacterium]|nr:FliA/WhiG family RNA polymerase sigma factor [Candidatus Brocadiaceae bacterium]
MSLMKGEQPGSLNSLNRVQDETGDSGAVKDRRRKPRKSGNVCRRRYPRKYNARDKEKIIEEHGQTVKFIAYKLNQALPSCVEADDLISAGIIGLMEAAERFDPDRGFKFKTFAEFRIRGAMLDELRRLDWVPRAMRDQSKQIEKARAEIEQKKGRAALDSEISKATGITVEKIEKIQQSIGFATLVNYEDYQNVMQLPERRDTSFEESKKNDARSVIEDTILSLKEKERRVLLMYYFEEMNQKEIGEVLQVTESRVSQLHSKAIKNLKKRLSVDQCEDLKLLLAGRSEA